MNISFIGSAASGKTTIAAMIFSKFKSMGITAEFITEQARLYIAEKKLENNNTKITLTDDDQVNIMSRQLKNDLVMSSSLNNRLGIVITDTSPLNSVLYMSDNYIERPQVLDMINKTINNTDILFYCSIVTNNFSYSDPNRIHSVEESIAIDKRIPHILKTYAINVTPKIIYLGGDLQERCQKALFSINDKYFKG